MYEYEAKKIREAIRDFDEGASLIKSLDDKIQRLRIAVPGNLQPIGFTDDVNPLVIPPALREPLLKWIIEALQDAKTKVFRHMQEIECPAGTVADRVRLDPVDPAKP